MDSNVPGQFPWRWLRMKLKCQKEISYYVTLIKGCSVVRVGQLTDSKYHRQVASIVPTKLMWSNDHSASHWHAYHQAGKPLRQEWKSWLSGTFSPILIHLAICLQLPMHTFTSAGTRSCIQSAFHQPLLGIGIYTVFDENKGDSLPLEKVSVRDWQNWLPS